MDKTQKTRLTLKFIEEMGIDNDHHISTLIDLISNFKNNKQPVTDLKKACFYLLRLIEKYEQIEKDEQMEIKTDVKIKRIYDNV